MRFCYFFTAVICAEPEATFYFKPLILAKKWKT